MTWPHQIATRAIGGTVSVRKMRDPSDDSERFAVLYESHGSRWQSSVIFEDASLADAGVRALADFLGAEVVR